MAFVIDRDFMSKQKQGSLCVSFTSTVSDILTLFPPLTKKGGQGECVDGFLVRGLLF
jgi:hypothetical protein